jgi:hypothetical protein
MVIAAVLGTGAASATAAGTFAVLRGAVIAAPAARDVPREQTPVVSTGHVSPLRVADPEDDAPAWTLRVARGTTGYLCSTVGQVHGRAFGLVGLDGRFRRLDPAIADACGQEQRGRVSLVGARVFAGRDDGAVRTVVNGVAGRELRRVEVHTTSGTSRAAMAEDGTFLAVLRGRPEDMGLRVVLTFADGHRQTERFGEDRSLVLDPDGGSAWRAQGTTMSGDDRTCVTFTWARRQARAPVSPAACGRLQSRGGSPASRSGIFFAVRRLNDRSVGRRPASVFGGAWNGRPARTAVWGAAGDDVRAVTVLGAPGGPRRLRTGDGVILGVLPGTVSAAALRVRITWVDGHSTVVRGDEQLVDPPARTDHGGTP